MTDDRLLELARPTDEVIRDLAAMSADLGTFARYYMEAERWIDEFALEVLARARSARAPLGAGEAKLVAARSLLAQLMVREMSHRLDAQNERAQRHRSEAAEGSAESAYLGGWIEGPFTSERAGFVIFIVKHGTASTYAASEITIRTADSVAVLLDHFASASRTTAACWLDNTTVESAEETP